MEHLFSKFTFRFLTIAILVGILISISLTIINTFTIGNPTHRAYDDEWLARHKTLASNLQDLDSINLSNPAKLDSVLRVVRNSQLTIIAYQSDLISDLRQETNNNINKLNQWLSFAVCMLALLGVIVPIVYQSRSYTYGREQLDKVVKEIEKKTNEYDHKFEELRKASETLINDLQDELNRKNEKQRLEIEENLKRARQLSSLTSLALGFNERTITSLQVERRQLLRFLWFHTIESVEEVVIIAFADSKTYNERRRILLETFVHVYSFARTIKANNTTKRNREWNNLVDEIRFLLCEISSATDCRATWHIIRHHISSIVERMHSLSDGQL